MSEPDGAAAERAAWSAILAATAEGRHLSVVKTSRGLLVTTMAPAGVDVRHFLAPDVEGVRDLLRACGASGV